MRKVVFIYMLVTGFTVKFQAQEREIVTSDNVKLYVSVKGKGEPCLYIHGGPGSGSY